MSEHDPSIKHIRVSPDGIIIQQSKLPPSQYELTNFDTFQNVKKSNVDYRGLSSMTNIPKRNYKLSKDQVQMYNHHHLQSIVKNQKMSALESRNHNSIFLPRLINQTMSMP